ncbi:protein ADM2a isoform X2 [Nelusetta ayraudi]|uniref:protein ADM2a isoform X2 n=1 Tax=Nelusetta ayraudi TaxID=303726 RepID=UPI003F72CECC
MWCFSSGLDLLNELMDQSNDEASPSESEDVPASTPGRFPEQLPGVQSRRASSRVKTLSPSLAWALPGNAPKVAKRVRRARNAHTGSRGGHHHHHHPHHGQLMRVGCVLGTCQVQNLSHRLYQLIGQSGREDSSPINPRSPHSFG